MRLAYAHDAVLQMNSTEDPTAIGAAVTVALCGASQHEPPCPLAPHHTSTERSGGEVLVRTLFAAEPGVEAEVRRQIDEALSSGRLETPGRASATWKFISSHPSAVRDTEQDHGDRLVRG